MILKNSLYTIVGHSMQENKTCYDIALDANHTIYQAHFPGEPITPGACLVQIAQELLEDHMQQAYQLCAIKNVKFLSVVSPSQHPRVTYVLEKVDADSADCKVVVQVLDPGSTTVFAKLSLLFHKR